MFQHFRPTIRTAMLGLVGIPLVALLAELAYDTNEANQANIAEAYRMATAINDITVAQTEQFLSRAEHILSELSHRPQVQALDRANCDPLLADWKRLQPAYANILTLDTSGRLVCSATGIQPGQAAGPDPKYYFAETVRTGKFTVGKPAKGFLSGRWVSTLAYPIQNRDGQLIGVVAASVDLAHYQSFVSARNLPPAAVIGIINGEGTIILRSEEAEQRVGRVSDAQSARIMLEQQRGVIRSRDYKGIDRLYAFAPIAHSDWIAFISLDAATVLAPAQRLALERLAFAIVAMLTIAALTLWLSRRIAKPIEAISKTITALTEGDLRARATASGPMEIHQIAVEFNAMLDARAKATDSLRASEESLNEAQQIAGVGSYVLDFSTGHWESSRELDRLFGVDAGYEHSVSGWEALIHPEDRGTMNQYFKNQVLGLYKAFNKEYRIIRHGDQKQRWVHGLGRLEFDAQGGLQKMIGTIQDITERKQADSQIQSLAYSDPLTGLPNRRLLMDRFEQAMVAADRHRRQGALLFIDLDDFKTLNDTLGHDKGDLLLRQISTRLIACVREGDTVARLGGDEFVVLLENLSNDLQEAATQAKAVGGKILKALGQPYQLDGRGQHSSASIGVTLFGGAERENIKEPLKRAELAMYQAKAIGRNTLCFFESEMRTAVNTRATLEADLREAVAQGQFTLYYQPQGGGDAHLMGVEALLRWQHPQRGLVSPAEFIPIAEASGLILPLGRWVLQTTCKQLAAWTAQPEMAHLTIAVNVSARQFKQPNFVEEVVTILEATGANPHRLKLELTESVLVDHVEDIIIKMNALQARGVGFSLDDFGTGYSSLSYLKRLPLDQLKIDKGFVRDIITDHNDAAIAKMVIALAYSLGLEVIAEGVETEVQRDFLAALGCHNYQGYLFSKPLPIQELEAFVQRG